MAGLIPAVSGWFPGERDRASQTARIEATQSNANASLKKLEFFADSIEYLGKRSDLLRKVEKEHPEWLQKQELPAKPTAPK